MRLLFVKESLAWPRISGHHVHTYYLLRALSQLGHALALVTNTELDAQAVAGLALERHYLFDNLGAPSDPAEPRLPYFQEFFHARWGIDKRFSRALRQAVEDFRPDAVVTVGWKELAYLSMVEGPVRVWYAGDDPVRYCLHQTLQEKPWSNLRLALSFTSFERAFRSRADRVWVVAGAERRLLRWLGGMRAVDVIPNGVDADYYRPGSQPALERSCVFWGRLDFAPNIQALQWFCRKVWPLLRQAAADARFTIYGFKPTAAVEALAGHDGVELVPNLPDLRSEICRHQVVVLPFVSAGGIKNKLLEAAGMGKAIVCSPRAASGLHLETESPFLIARRPRQWTHAIASLWADPDRRRSLGQAARTWVMEHHDWQTAARLAIAGIEASLESTKSFQKSTKIFQDLS
jgi:glycosyltransferase involved in cell wall biosynthesis